MGFGFVWKGFWRRRQMFGALRRDAAGSGLDFTLGPFVRNCLVFGQWRGFSVSLRVSEEGFGCAKLAPLSAIFPLGKVVESGLGVRR